MTTIDFIFDVGSPNAYLCHKVLASLARRTGAHINYIPCLLGGIFKATGNQSPFMAHAGIKNKLEYEQLEMQRFIDKHNIPFRMNPNFPVNTLQLMRGAVVADLEGQQATYIEGLFHYMWEEPRPLDDSAVLQQTLSELGLDAATYWRRMHEDGIKKKLADNTQAAVDRGAFGIPTFFVGEAMWFGKERLGDIEAYLAEQKR